jgi:uncharacterized protein YutE (UPF0331/DUF86 family)
MSESAFVKSVVEDYAKSGYRVTTNPRPDQLPAALADVGADLIARGDKETIAVQIKRRDELYDLMETRSLAERVEQTPGWRLDVVVAPANGDGDVPLYGTELDARRIQELVDEAEAGLNAGALRSAFLVAWAATEASMRDVARRTGLLTEREAPGFVLKTLYSNGVISREEYEEVQRHYRVRSAIVHGLEPAALAEADVRSLLEFAERLRSAETADVGP